MNLGWLLLVQDLELTDARCCLFERIQEVVQQEPRPAIHMEKQLGWAHKLGGAKSLEISKASRTVLARLIESQIWHQLASSVALLGNGLEKGQWPLLALMPMLQFPPVCQ